MTRIVRLKLTRAHFNGFKRVCLIKPESIFEWIIMWFRGWRIHEVLSGEKFMIKYYHYDMKEVKYD